MKKMYFGALMASIAFGSKTVNEAPFQLKNNYWTETFDGIGASPTPTEGPSWTSSNGTWKSLGLNGNHLETFVFRLCGSIW